jgi:hypothetical protein
MYDHAELAAFLFYTAYLAIQVIFDYRCVRCFSVIPGYRSACFPMILGCCVFSVTLGLRVIFSVLFVCTAWYSLSFKYIYYSVMYQSPAWLFLHQHIPLLTGYSFFLSLRWFSNIPLLAANCGMDDVPPSPVIS